MRCILCQNISLPVICKACRAALLSPTLSTRTLSDGFKIYSCYRYTEIAPLLKTKHTHIGAAVYRVLADEAFGWFKERFEFAEHIAVIPVDDRPKSGYAHTAILARALASPQLRPRYATLHATSDISYSGKTLAFRKSHPRAFRYSGKNIDKAILIDDIVTTGTTLSEAKSVLEKAGATPLFALTLADAK